MGAGPLSDDRIPSGSLGPLEAWGSPERPQGTRGAVSASNPAFLDTAADAELVPREADVLVPGASFNSGWESGSAIRGAHLSGKGHYGPNSPIPYSDLGDPRGSRKPFHSQFNTRSVSNSRGNPQKAWEVLSVDREASQR